MTRPASCFLLCYDAQHEYFRAVYTDQIFRTLILTESISRVIGIRRRCKKIGLMDLKFPIPFIENQKSYLAELIIL